MIFKTRSSLLNLIRHKNTFAFASSKFVHQINSEQEFNKKITEIKVPILIDFYANWCMPCKALTPRLIQKNQKDAGKWVLFKINVDEQDNAGLCQKYRVNSIPHLAFTKQGKLIQTKIGNLSDQALEDLLNR